MQQQHGPGAPAGARGQRSGQQLQQPHPRHGRGGASGAGTAGAQLPPAPNPEAVEQLVAMGFDAERAARALQVTSPPNNIDQAVSLLIS